MYIISSTKLKEFEEAQEWRHMEQFFRNLDTDHSGAVSREEFLCACDNRELRNKLKVLGVDEGELHNLFYILDDEDGEGELDVQEFCKGISMLKGDASAKDLFITMRNVERLQKKMDFLLRKTVREPYRSVSKDDDIKHGRYGTSGTKELDELFTTPARDIMRTSGC